MAVPIEAVAEPFTMSFRMIRMRFCVFALLLAAACSDGSGTRANKPAGSDLRVSLRDKARATLTSEAGEAYVAPQALFLRAVTAPGMLNPMRIALGPDGQSVVSDPRARALFVFSRGGSLVERVALAQRPLSVAVDPTGRYLVGDADGSRLLVMSPGGAMPRMFCAGAGEFKKPNDIAVDPISGLVWIVDSGNDRVVACTWEGVFVRSFGSAGSNPGEFTFPLGVAIDPATSQVYVSDMNNGRVQVFEQTGVFVRAVGSYGGANGQLARPAGLALDDLNRLYVGDLFQSRVQAFDPAGNHLRWIGEPGDQPGQLLLPTDLVVDQYKRLLIISQGSRKIEVVGLDGYTDPPDEETPLALTAELAQATISYGPSIAPSYICLDVPGSTAAIVASSVRIDGSIALDDAGILETDVKCNGNLFEAQARVRLAPILSQHPGGGAFNLSVTGRLRDGNTFAGIVAVTLTGGAE